jgi:hypothetical protein
VAKKINKMIIDGSSIIKEVIFTDCFLGLSNVLLATAPGLYGMAPKLLLRIFYKRSKGVDTPFHQALKFRQQNPRCPSLFGVMPDVLEGVASLVDRTPPIINPFIEHTFR